MSFLVAFQVGLILPTISITDEDDVNLLILYDVDSLVYGSTGIAMLGGNVQVGAELDGLDHGLTMQANR